jgi:protein-arginine deiminase
MVAPERVFGAANTDDDDENGVQDVFDGDDPIDRATFAVLADPAAPERGVASYEITMSGDMGATVFLDGELLLHGLTGPFTDEVSWSADPLDLAVDFAGFNTETLLTVSELSAAGRVLDSRVIRLVSAPLLLNHHLQPAEQLFTVRTRGGFFIGDNVEFVTPMTDALGDLMWEVEGSTVGQDVWIQDEVEFATSNFDDRTHDIVVDSIRDRGLDTWPEAAFYGPDWAVHTWGSGFGNTYDSFGNLEASPPVTVGDTTYPFGRIYYGAEGGASPNAALTNFLAAQEVQAPFELDTSWLCVGHVDEFMSFVPDATSPKGFRMVWTDIPGAWELIDAMDPGIMMPRMRDHGHGTVESFQTDSHLRDYNADLDAVFLEPMKAQIMAELGLVESDIIYVPGLFEEACGRLAAAMVPGMANLVVSNPEGGPSHILTADPFFRTDTFDRSADPFVAAFEAAMPAEHEVVWVDDWEDYHLLLGEVHCGTNVVRTQTLDWWTDADALERMGE